MKVLKKNLKKSRKKIFSKSRAAFQKKIAAFFFAFLSSVFCSAAFCENFQFIDAGGGEHETSLYKNVPRNNFSKKKFRSQASRLWYEGGGYVSKIGIDISHHDGKVDWKKVKEWGVEFAILRVGYMGYQTGKITPDTRFHENARAAIREGIEIGVYIFAQAVTEEEAQEEAQFVLQEIAPYKITLPVFYDPESIPWDKARTDDVSKEQFTKNALAFCKAISEAGYAPAIYMNMMWQAYNLDLEELRDYPIWYADYEKIPQTPYDFEFWQYSCMGIVDGIEIPKNKNCMVDMNIWLKKKSRK